MLTKYDFFDDLEKKVIFSCEATTEAEANKLFEKETGAKYHNVRYVFRHNKNSPVNNKGKSPNDPILITCPNCHTDSVSAATTEVARGAAFCIFCKRIPYTYIHGLWYKWRNGSNMCYTKYIGAPHWWQNKI